MSLSGKILFPGIPATTDGAGAVVWVETNVTQGACAYPITSSTTMGGGYQQAVADGQKNLWGDPLQFIEPESEHSAASTCEGFALAGGRVTNFTSGQGLVLMKEVLYTISGKRLPVVFHIGARALTSHSLNVHAGHDDVMSVADCGWGILFGRNAQEACDLALIARRAAEDSETPFMNVQDGFLTTHTVENVRLPELEMMKQYLGNPNEKLRNFMDPHHPLMSGVVQNQDSYMKGKIAQRYYYDKVPAALEHAFDEFRRLTGRRYAMIDSYRMDDAELAVVGLGGMMETAQAAADYIRQQHGIKLGAVHVTAFRPFPSKQLVDALKHVRAVTVLERMDDPLSTTGNHLTRELKAAFAEAVAGQNGHRPLTHMPKIYSGSAGLGSRDVRAGDFIAVVRNMQADRPREYFCLGIKHELALEVTEDPDVRPAGAFSMRGHSVGGFGSVTTNKLIATIIGDADLFGLCVQAYPKYGSEKKGLPTTYYLTIAPEHIRTHSELEHVDFVPLNDVNAFNLGNPLHGLREGGMVFVQSDKTAPAEVWAAIPEWAKKVIRRKKLRILALDTVAIARETASEPDLQQRMQGVVLLGVFLKATPFRLQRKISDEQLFTAVEGTIRKYWGKRGQQTVQDNLKAVKRGFNEVFEIPAEMMI
jgi:pyruvate-ferredoxin/flavodoxin oxidoreductase